MNTKPKWVPGFTRAMILFLLPSLILAWFLSNGGYRMGPGTLFLIGLIMTVWLVFVVFGISKEG